MATYNLAALTTAFVGGAEVFGKEVLNWNLRELGIQIRTNVNTPQALTKFTSEGVVQPYRKQDDFHALAAEDRILTAYQSKVDLELDAEDFRNTYLAELPEMPFEQFSVAQAAKEFLASIQTNTLYSGVRNGAGTAAADVCDGWGTILAAEVTATNITETATGAITSANAVTKVELVADAQSAMMKEQGFIIYCSYDVLAKYRIHYRTLNGFGFNKNEVGQYKLDGQNGVLIPCSFMGTSQRLIATKRGNLVLGTDLDRMSMYPTPHLNLLQTRLMMPFGCQIRDIGAEVLTINDQA